MKSSLITLAAFIILALNTNAQGPNASIDTDPVSTASNIGHGDNDKVIVRQLAYPIPTYDYLTLELEGKASTSVRIRIEDAAGNEIYDLFRVVDLDPDFVGRIDMRDQPKAVYTLIVETPSGDPISKIEIEKR
jgi:hypothetical protein